MITPMQMYWLVKLDSIRGAAFAFSILAFAISVMIVAFSVPALDEYCLGTIWKTIKKTLCTLLTIGFLLAAVHIFTPSTKQMAAIVTIPTVLNNEKLQDMGNKTLDIGTDLLELTKQYIEKRLDEK